MSQEFFDISFYRIFTFLHFSAIFVISEFLSQFSFAKVNLSSLRSHFDDFFFFRFRVGSYEEADETDTYGTFNNGTTNNDRPVLRTQSTVDETTQGTYEGFKGSLKGLKLYWSQFLGLLVKRLIYTKRRYLLYGILVSQNSVTFEKFSFPPLLF